MFRCKKWLRTVTTDCDVEYNGTVIHAVNVPAKLCPECGEVTVPDIIRERVIQYASDRGRTAIDYDECENEEAAGGQALL